MRRRTHTRKGFNLPRSNSEAVAHPRRGFNLIESAIVLGVVGLIIGAIWVAAAAVSENRKLSQAVSGTLVILKKTREMFPPRIDQTSYGNINLYSTETELIAENIITSADGFGWSEGMHYGMSPFRSQDGDFSIIVFPTYLQFQFLKISTARCMKLVPALTASFHDTSDLTTVSLIGGAVTSFPIMPTAAQCGSAIGRVNNLNFRFNR